jgi:hypothetical protein
MPASRRPGIATLPGSTGWSRCSVRGRRHKSTAGQARPAGEKWTWKIPGNRLASRCRI